MYLGRHLLIVWKQREILNMETFCPANYMYIVGIVDVGVM